MNSRSFAPGLLLCAAFTIGSMNSARAADGAESFWPAWRGPLLTGVGPAANPPVTWSETENVRWKVEVPGSGTSTPIIWGDQLFVLTAIAAGDAKEGEQPSREQQFTVISYDRDTGKIRWQDTPKRVVPHEGHHKDHGYASASPVTDGEVLVVSFGSRGVYGYDLKGKQLWSKDLGQMKTRNSFGEGSSPALSGTIVVLIWDHEGADDFVVALDKRSGKELWRQARAEDTNWTTPLIVEHAGKKQVIVNGSNSVRSYDLESGAPIWQAPGLTKNVIPAPVAGHGRVYATSGFRGAVLQAIDLGAKGDVKGTPAIAWTHNKNTPYVPSPLLYGDLLYFFSGNNAQLSIFDARSGQAKLDAARLEGIFGVYASPVGAADRVYLTGRDGNCWVIKNAPGLEVLAKNKLNDNFDASPALVGGEMFLRGRKHLYSIAEKAKTAAR